MISKGRVLTTKHFSQGKGTQFGYFTVTREMSPKVVILAVFTDGTNLGKDVLNVYVDEAKCEGEVC